MGAGLRAAPGWERALYAILRESAPLILTADNGSLWGRAEGVQGAFVKIPRIANYRKIFFMLGALTMAACDGTWNNPYPAAEKQQNTHYSSFELRPKHLDPAQSYSSNEVVFTGQIYEPPLQYHYLKRPYELIPLTAEAVPVPYYEDAQGHRLPGNAPPQPASVALSCSALRACCQSFMSV